jgi:hypothetical protein
MKLIRRFTVLGVLMAALCAMSVLPANADSPACRAQCVRLYNNCLTHTPPDICQENLDACIMSCIAP